MSLKNQMLYYNQILHTAYASVSKVTSLNDKTATETKKQSMITDKQDKYYKKVLKKWKKEEKITVQKGSWNKISFTKLSVKAKDTSTTETTSTSGN